MVVAVAVLDSDTPVPATNDTSVPVLLLRETGDAPTENARSVGEVPPDPPGKVTELPPAPDMLNVCPDIDSVCISLVGDGSAALIVKSRPDRTTVVPDPLFQFTVPPLGTDTPPLLADASQLYVLGAAGVVHVHPLAVPLLVNTCPAVPALLV
jgi:hypothetical protein